MHGYRLDSGNAVNWGHSLNRGLVAWYLALPDQQRGVMFRDLCKRNHGTLTSMDPATDWVGPRDRPGGFGALDFAASQAVVTSLRITGAPFSISWWGRGNTDTVNYRAFRQSDFASDSSFMFTYDNQSSGFAFFRLNLSGVNKDVATTTFRDAVNFWTHFTVTWDGATLVLYRNGKQVDSEAAVGTMTGGAGYFLKLGDEEMRGLLDSVRVQVLALSAGESAALYTEEARGYPGLLNWQQRYRFAPEQGGAVTAFPWHYYQQMMAG